MTRRDTILVTGATGNVGRHVVSLLRRADAPVRALTRDPPAAHLPGDVEVTRGDLDAPESLAAAVADAGTVFLLWPSFSADGAAAAVEAVTRHARRVVYLSALQAGDQPDSVWGTVERLVEASGVDWTFLRCGGFATNTLAWADRVRAEGVVRAPYAEAARSLIHEADIAEVAVRALTGEGHAGRAYALTGPEAVTQAEQAHLIGEAIGRPVRFEEQSEAEAREELLAVFGDPALVDASLAYWRGLVTEPEPVTTTVAEVTGRPARTYEQWARDHAADFDGPVAAR
ncbi:NAD(P)H-binding protein [Micromonospora sp. NPDC049497]|uniref:NAD(P)H-binding protein n=1 Tax=Micromonospora sp. NPDC049497 TaxID=3364273 RepID=UPI0037A0D422